MPKFGVKGPDVDYDYNKVKKAIKQSVRTTAHYEKQVVEVAWWAARVTALMGVAVVGLPMVVLGALVGAPKLLEKSPEGQDLKKLALWYITPPVNER